VRIGLGCALFVLAGTSAVFGQELEPRVYLASPVGSNVVVVAAARSTGDVILDPTIPIEDVRARVGAIVFGYYRTFGVFGRSASFGGTAPMLRASAQGQIDGVEGRVNRFGQGDVSTRFTVNLLGFPAMDTATYVKRGPRPGLGASVVVNIPTGQYLSDKVINLGTNRWSYKPELGLTVPLGDRWLFDTYFGVWLFSDDDADASQLQLVPARLGGAGRHLLFRGPHDGERERAGGAAEQHAHRRDDRAATGQPPVASAGRVERSSSAPRIQFHDDICGVELWMGSRFLRYGLSKHQHGTDGPEVGDDVLVCPFAGLEVSKRGDVLRAEDLHAHALCMPEGPPGGIHETERF